MVADITSLAAKYGRYGYRRITAMLRKDGWRVNHKRVERIWRQEGLKVPQKQPKRGRLWLNDGSCIRLRPEHKDHVWSYDFVIARTADGRAFKMLTIIDEYTRECLGACLSKLSPAGKKRGLPSCGYRISSINQEIRWEELSAGSNNLCPQAIF